jgi:ferritin-like metal-binding protein YciE
LFLDFTSHLKRFAENLLIKVPIDIYFALETKFQLIIYKIKNMESKSKNSSTNKSNEAEISNHSEMANSKLMKLFEEELKDIYWAEKRLTKAIPKMIKKATSEELKDALENHLEETEDHVARVEQVFDMIDRKAAAQKCEAMAGLVVEAEEIMDDCEDGAMLDAGIIVAGQKVEHYEIASYGTLIQFAKTLNLNDVANLLAETLKEEKAANDKLSEIALDEVNTQAASEDGSGLW